MRPLRRLAFAAVTLSLQLPSACASAPGASARASNSGTSDVITSRELADPSLVGATALDAVRRLRPRFLIDRGGGKGNYTGGLLVSANGTDLVGPTELGRISVDEVTEIRYLSATDAAQKFGTRGTMGPVIVLTLKPR